MIKSKKIKIEGPSKKAETWIFWPDTHFPDQNDEAVEVAKKIVEIIKPLNFCYLGDLIDCAIFSQHPKRSLIETKGYDFNKLEIEPANKLIDFTQKYTKNKTYFIEGNHCVRAERWCISAGRVGESIFEYFSPKILLSKNRKKFQYLPYCVPTGNFQQGYVEVVPETSGMIPALSAVHGWSFAENAAAVHLNKSRSRSLIYGHVHRQEQKVSRDPWSGKVVMAASPGCLSKLQPIYATGNSPSSWVNGLGLLFVGSESWSYYNLLIVNGRCVLPDGREIRIN